MKQREVIFRTEYKGHQLEVVRYSSVPHALGRKLRVDRTLQAFVNGTPLKAEESEKDGLKRDLIELAQAVAEQLPPRSS